MSWPLIVVAVGAGLLVLGLLVGAPEMAIPAVIVGGIGGILYYQNLSGNWASWSYLWTLIPGFSGLECCSLMFWVHVVNITFAPHWIRSERAW